MLLVANIFACKSRVTKGNILDQYAEVYCSTNIVHIIVQKKKNIAALLQLRRVAERRCIKIPYRFSFSSGSQYTFSLWYCPTVSVSNFDCPYRYQVVVTISIFTRPGFYLLTEKVNSREIIKETFPAIKETYSRNVCSKETRAEIRSRSRRP